MEPVCEHLKLQAVAHRSKLLDIHVGFVVGVVYLIGWMDHGLPERLLMGHRVVGTLAPTGVFSSRDTEVPSMSTRELTSVEHRSSVTSTFAQQPMSEHREFIIEPCRKDMQSGWASDFMTAEQVRELFPQSWCPKPAFVHNRHVASRVGSTMQRQAILLSHNFRGTNQHDHGDAASHLRQVAVERG